MASLRCVARLRHKSSTYPLQVPLNSVVASRSTALLFSRTNGLRHASFPAKSTHRVSTIFSVLMTVGIATTAFGLYMFYSSFTLWPVEVRSDLRAGIKAKHQGDLNLSARYLQRAWETAQSLPISAFGSTPYLKITGILIALAEVLESNNQPQLAYELMGGYLEKLPPREADPENAPAQWTGPERMRLVAIAFKLGEMANIYSRPITEEKDWLFWCFNELAATLRRKKASPVPEPALFELELPNWVSKTDVVAPLEALGAFLSRTGDVQYALALYLETLSILVPDDSSNEATPTDRCRGAQVMSNLAELLTRASSSLKSPEEVGDTLKRAELWAIMAVKLVTETWQLREEYSGDLSPCSESLAVIVANLGTINLRKGDADMARKFFRFALTHALQIGNKSQVVQLQRLLLEAERPENSMSHNRN